jgi:hypothetical protein
MDKSATNAACDQIEAALWRIDAALARIRTQPETSPEAQVDADLPRRHELLREATASALLAIDALIADAGEPAA